MKEWIPKEERFGLDKYKHTHTAVYRRGGSTGPVNERRKMKTMERRSIGPQRGTGSSTPVSTTWPLPALRIPNPVITQNTRGLTRSEPGPDPTLPLWTVWVVCFSLAVLSGLEPTVAPTGLKNTFDVTLRFI